MAISWLQVAALALLQNYVANCPSLVRSLFLAAGVEGAELQLALLAEARKTLPSAPGGRLGWLWLGVGLTIALIVAVAALRRARRRRVTGPASVSSATWQAWDADMWRCLAQHGQITPEMLASIPSPLRLMAMRRYVHAHGELDLLWRDAPPSIEVGRAWKLRRFVRDWASLGQRLENPQRAAPLVARIVEQLCDLLSFIPLERRLFRSLFGYQVRAPTVRLSIPPSFAVISILQREPGSATLANVRDMMRVLNASSFFGLLIVPDHDAQWREQLEAVRRLVHGGAHDLIVLDGQDLCSLYLARDPERRLVDLILRQVDLTVVSPYVVSGPVPENMFFGHDYELKSIMRLIHDRSFAIVGGRKIGKTSVLNKLHRLMQQSSGLAPFYLDCQFVMNYEEFFGTVAYKCQVQVESAAPEVMRRVALRLRRQHGDEPVLLLDEVDRILAYDMQQDMRLFRLFRALSQEGLCRFVFCGERQLNQAFHDATSPLFNFCNVLRLTYLTPREARRIVDEPMAAMGITFEAPDELPERIVALSSCHPNLVQVICQMLVVRINARQERIIRLDDLAQVRASSEFRDTFFEVIWGNASDLERLISVLMVRTPRFTVADVHASLEQGGVRVPPSEVQNALADLVFFSLLKQQGDYYTYGAPSFVELALESSLAVVLADGLLDKLRAQP